MARKRSNGRNRRSFSELFFQARPRPVLEYSKTIAGKRSRRFRPAGSPAASNKAYIKWLVSESMLTRAHRQALHYSGTARLWQNPYAKPRPRAALDRASVWYTAYPISMIAREGVSALAALGDEELWEVFHQIGIRGLHTGPMKMAGGLSGWSFTPSVDGHFDRISNSIDPVFGDEDEFRTLCRVAEEHGGVVIDDIVPGHTGKGADFRLAEMSHGEYPGIYHMVEIDRKDWHRLPDCPPGRDSVNISPDVEEQFKKDGYIIGKLQRVIFYEPGVKETNWSVTRPVVGVDGVERRWIYLHYFKEGQPSINWLDPSFAGMRLVVGDALHSMGTLGTTGLRLDANGFLGVEKGADDGPAWSEGHPLSTAANQMISGMVRKFGGFTFQELNLSIDDIKAMSIGGADLSYDFINRPAYHHTLATSDTEFLRMTLRLTLEYDIDPASLIHALQNHDELTYELVHFWTTHQDDEFEFRGTRMRGIDIRDIIRTELRTAVTGKAAPYNLLFTENGIACTTASFVAAALGHHRLDQLTEEDARTIATAHLLLAKFNAWQPGVFALSGWDLVGALTLPRTEVAELIAEGDTRWINRGAYDLLGNRPDASHATSGMARAARLYGDLPSQLGDEASFASQLKRVLALREKLGIHCSRQLDIPPASHPSLLVMIHLLPGKEGTKQITALNFSGEKVDARVRSPHLFSGSVITDAWGDHPDMRVNARRGFRISLEPYEGTVLTVSETQGG